MRERLRLILVGIGAFLVCLVFFLVFVQGQKSELADVNEQVEAEENNTLALQAQLDHLRDLQQRAPRFQAELAEIRELVPENDNVANFIFLVQEAANQAGVGFVQITPETAAPPPEIAPVAQVRITIRAQGSYFSIQDFTRRLYDLDRALRVDLLSIAPSEEGGTGTDVTLDLDITARIFFELPEGAVPGVVIPEPGTTPPATPPATPVPEPTPTA